MNYFKNILDEGGVKCRGHCGNKVLINACENHKVNALYYDIAKTFYDSVVSPRISVVIYVNGKYFKKLFWPLIRYSKLTATIMLIIQTNQHLYKINVALHLLS